MSLHSLAAGADLHDDKRYKRDVRVAAPSNVVISSPGATIDGVTMVSGDRVLLYSQTTASQNGIYQWNGASLPLTRTADASRDVDFVPGFLVYSREGDTSAVEVFVFNTFGSISVGITSLVFGLLGGFGPQGDVGPQGPTGPTGARGDAGDSTAALDAPYILIQDQKSSGTTGGTFTSGAYRTRDLNTIVANNQSSVSLASNQLTLQPGQYRVAISCPAYKVDAHAIRLQSITDSSTVLVGTTEFASSTDTTMTRSYVNGRFILLSAKTLEVQHRCQTTEATDGMGIAASFGTNEVYSSVEIWFVGASPPIGTQRTELPPRRRPFIVAPIRNPSNTILPV